MLHWLIDEGLRVYKDVLPSWDSWLRHEMSLVVSELLLLLQFEEVVMIEVLFVLFEIAYLSLMRDDRLLLDSMLLLLMLLQVWL